MTIPDARLEAFYRGERKVIEDVYRAHYADVDRGASRVVAGIDRESVVHDMFFQLLSSEPFRRGFKGGELGRWLQVVAANQAISLLRKQKREVPAGDVEQLLQRPDGSRIEEQAIAQQFFARFRASALPAKWAPVFEACFVEGLDQRSAAEKLGIARTTLAYQWVRIKWALEAFAKEHG